MAHTTLLEISCCGSYAINTEISSAGSCKQIPSYFSLDGPGYIYIFFAINCIHSQFFDLHAQLSSGSRCLNFSLTRHQLLYFGYVSSKSAGKTIHGEGSSWPSLLIDAIYASTQGFSPYHIALQQRLRQVSAYAQTPQNFPC